jgi:hypothetical protein
MSHLRTARQFPYPSRRKKKTFRTDTKLTGKGNWRYASRRFIGKNRNFIEKKFSGPNRSIQSILIHTLEFRYLLGIKVNPYPHPFNQ